MMMSVCFILFDLIIDEGQRTRDCETRDKSAGFLVSQTLVFNERKNSKYRANHTISLTEKIKNKPKTQSDSFGYHRLETHNLFFHTFAPVKNLNDIISPIAVEVAQFEAFFRKTLRADTEPMDSIMRYVLDTRGKRLRPVLVLLGAKLFGEVNEQTLRVAAFVEMVHTATLIHDDVVDDDDQRRGQASVKARFGNLSAVLAGDYLLAKAVHLLAHPDDHAILDVMLRTTAAMSEGELMQGAAGLSYEGGRYDNRQDSGCHDVTDLYPQYIDIITRKTAMLMQACCTAGALSVGASSEQIQLVSDFGLLFGILFQLSDDLLDGENTEATQVLLPVYFDKTMQSLESLSPSEIRVILKNLTVFCVEREG